MNKKVTLGAPRKYEQNPSWAILRGYVMDLTPQTQSLVDVGPTPREQNNSGTKPFCGYNAPGIVSLEYLLQSYNECLYSCGM